MNHLNRYLSAAAQWYILGSSSFVADMALPWYCSCEQAARATASEAAGVLETDPDRGLDSATDVERRRKVHGLNQERHFEFSHVNTFQYVGSLTSQIGRVAGTYSAIHPRCSNVWLRLSLKVVRVGVWIQWPHK